MTESSSYTDVIETLSLDCPNEIAITSSEGTLSYRDFNTLTWKATHYLASRGILPGDIVAISLGHPLHLLLSQIAVSRLGGTVFTVPPHYPLIQRQEMLTKVNAKHILSTRKPDKDEESLIANIAFVRDSFKDMSGQSTNCLKQFDPESIAIIIYGSGSTGDPKLIPHSQVSYLKHLERSANIRSLTANDTHAIDFDFTFFSGAVFALGTLLKGGCLAFWKKKPNDISELKELGVTFLSSTPFHLEQRCNSLPEETRNALGFLRGGSVGASPVSDYLREKIYRKLSGHFIVSFGANECGQISVASTETSVKNPGSVGFPAVGTEVEIVDDRGNPLANGNVGNLKVRTPCMADGYMGDPEATKLAFVDGWFYPGDLAKLTPEGELIHYGRSDQMMIFNGINIYPAEIENMVLSFPGVREALAFPLRSTVHQDVPVCAILVQDRLKFDLSALTGFLDARLGVKSPKKVAILAEIPRDPRGKVIRTALHEVFYNAINN
jgi:cyanophycin synthetase